MEDLRFENTDQRNRNSLYTLEYNIGYPAVQTLWPVALCEKLLASAAGTAKG